MLKLNAKIYHFTVMTKCLLEIWKKKVQNLYVSK